MDEVNSDARIRSLCQRLAEEKDLGEVEKLAGELRRVVNTEQDEVRLRLRYIVHHYRDRVRAIASQRPESMRGLQIRALIAFLGIGPKISCGVDIQKNYKPRLC